MYHIHSNIFNPEIIYVVDFWNKKKNLRGYHHHDFIEISIVLEGTVDYEFIGLRPVIFRKTFESWAGLI